MSEQAALEPTEPQRSTAFRDVQDFVDLLNNQARRQNELWDNVGTFQGKLYKSASFWDIYPELMKMIDTAGGMIGAVNRESRPTMFQETQVPPEDGEGSAEIPTTVVTNLSELGFRNAMDVMDYGTPEQAARLTPTYLAKLRDYVEGVRLDRGDAPTTKTDRLALERIRPYVADFIVRVMHHLESSRSTKEEEGGRTMAYADALVTGTILAHPEMADRIRRMSQERQRWRRRGTRATTSPRSQQSEAEKV